VCQRVAVGRHYQALWIFPTVGNGIAGLGCGEGERGAIAAASILVCRSEAAGGRNAAAFVSGGPEGVHNLGAAALAAPAAYGEAGERPHQNRSRSEHARVQRSANEARPLLLANQECPQKKTRAGPSVPARVCPAKSLTRGEENIPQTILIKQSACQLRKRFQNAGIAIWQPDALSKIPPWVHLHRNRFDPVQEYGD